MATVSDNKHRYINSINTQVAIAIKDEESMFAMGRIDPDDVTVDHEEIH